MVVIEQLGYVMLLPHHGKCMENTLKCRKFEKKINDWKTHCCSGFINQMMHGIMERLQLNVDTYLVKDNYWGEYRNGSWMD